MTTQQQWLTPEEIGEELRIPVGTIYAWKYKGTGPRFRKIGRHLRVSRSDLDAWLEAQADPQPASSSS